jgi:hypothetical protein
MTQQSNSDETQVPRGGLGKSWEWWIIPLGLILVGVERSLTGTNLLLRSEPIFGGSMLILGIIATVIGAGLWSSLGKS